MKKLMMLLMIFATATAMFAADVSLSFQKGNTYVTTTPEYMPDFLRGGYTLLNEATTLANLYANNYDPYKNTISVSPTTTYTSITFTANTVTVSTTGSEASTVDAALKTVRIGSIIETAHSTMLQGIVRGIVGRTITVGSWYQITSTAAIMPSPTTGTAFYINNFKKSDNTLINGFLSGQTIVGATTASGNLTLSSTSNVTKGSILFGTSAYDEANNRLGIGKTSPTVALDVVGDSVISGTIYGDTAASGSLILSSTSNVTKGAIILQDFITMGNATSAASIKMLKLSGTTPASTGTAVNIPHGLTGAKIVSVNSVVRSSANVGVLPSTTSPAAVSYNLAYDATNIRIDLLADSGSITEKAVDVIVTYIE